MSQNRRYWMKKMLALIAGIGLVKGSLWASHTATHRQHKETSNDLFNQNNNNMKLGAFSMSLNVKDLATSKIFYENLGFTAFGGSMQQNYLIMKNERALIGLFQGMFPNNILTFNPGWDYNAQPVDGYDDVRKIQEQLKAKGVKLDTEADEKTSGPASLMLTDPDGNILLLDQHL